MADDRYYGRDDGDREERYRGAQEDLDRRVDEGRDWDAWGREMDDAGSDSYDGGDCDSGGDSDGDG